MSESHRLRARDVDSNAEPGRAGWKQVHHGCRVSAGGGRVWLQRVGKWEETGDKCVDAERVSKPAIATIAKNMCRKRQNQPHRNMRTRVEGQQETLI